MEADAIAGELRAVPNSPKGTKGEFEGGEWMEGANKHNLLFTSSLSLPSSNSSIWGSIHAGNSL